jgi:uncharacterized membrane protein (DUF373 family)
MADYQTDVSDDKAQLTTPHPPTAHDDHANHAKEDEDPLATRFGHLLDRADTLIYIIVGASFLIGALFALFYSFWDLGSQLIVAFRTGTLKIIAATVIEFVSGLLLVLIIMEVLSTVIHYLKEHATSLRPFLFIGIISATRSILSVGARLSIGQTSGGEPFINSMLELGVSAVVVLALGITLKLLGRMADVGASEQ